MGPMFYLVAAVMAVLGFVATCWPLLRARRLGWAAASAVLMAAGLVALYPLASNYVVRSPAYAALSQATTEAEARAAAAALAADLAGNDRDYAGWRLLGQGYMELGEFDEAQVAFRQAMAIGGFADPELKVMLGEAITYASGELPEEATRLFLDAYAEAPANSKAQWYAGLAYAALGRPAAAASAWEALLAQGPPENVAMILRERIAALRANADGVTSEAVAGNVALTVSLADGLSSDWPASARLYVSVRDANRPGPPLAARQYDPGSLPLSVQLDDRDAMVQGRTISSASELVISARVSMSGDPLGGAGDYLGRITVSRAALAGEPLTLIIEQVVD